MAEVCFCRTESRPVKHEGVDGSLGLGWEQLQGLSGQGLAPGVSHHLSQEQGSGGNWGSPSTRHLLGNGDRPRPGWDVGLQVGPVSGAHGRAGLGCRELEPGDGVGPWARGR